MEIRLAVSLLEYITLCIGNLPIITHPLSFDQFAPPFDATAIREGSEVVIDVNNLRSPNMWLEAPVSKMVGRELLVTEKAVL